MNVAEVKKTELKTDYPEMKEISAILDKKKERLRISTINWKGFAYKPEVALSLGYSDHELFLKYYIKENYFKAEKTETNQMVCEDSCVEFLFHLKRMAYIIILSSMGSGPVCWEQALPVQTAEEPILMSSRR